MIEMYKYMEKELPKNFKIEAKLGNNEAQDYLRSKEISW